MLRWLRLFARDGYPVVASEEKASPRGPVEFYLKEEADAGVSPWGNGNGRENVSSEFLRGWPVSMAPLIPYLPFLVPDSHPY